MIVWKVLRAAIPQSLKTAAKKTAEVSMVVVAAGAKGIKVAYTVVTEDLPPQLNKAWQATKTSMVTFKETFVARNRLATVVGVGLIIAFWFMPGLGHWIAVAAIVDTSLVVISALFKMTFGSALYRQLTPRQLRNLLTAVAAHAGAGKVDAFYALKNIFEQGVYKMFKSHDELIDTLITMAAARKEETGLAYYLLAKTHLQQPTVKPGILAALSKSATNLKEALAEISLQVVSKAKGDDLVQKIDKHQTAVVVTYIDQPLPNGYPQGIYEGEIFLKSRAQEETGANPIAAPPSSPLGQDNMTVSSPAQDNILRKALQLTGFIAGMAFLMDPAMKMLAVAITALPVALPTFILVGGFTLLGLVMSSLAVGILRGSPVQGLTLAWNARRLPVSMTLLVAGASFFGKHALSLKAVFTMTTQVPVLSYILAVLPNILPAAILLAGIGYLAQDIYRLTHDKPARFGSGAWKLLTSGPATILTLRRAAQPRPFHIGLKQYPLLVAQNPLWFGLATAAGALGGAGLVLLSPAAVVGAKLAIAIAAGAGIGLMAPFLASVLWNFFMSAIWSNIVFMDFVENAYQSGTLDAAFAKQVIETQAEIVGGGKLWRPFYLLRTVTVAAQAVMPVAAGVVQFIFGRALMTMAGNYAALPLLEALGTKWGVGIAYPLCLGSRSPPGYPGRIWNTRWAR